MESLRFLNDTLSGLRPFRAPTAFRRAMSPRSQAYRGQLGPRHNRTSLGKLLLSQSAPDYVRMSGIKRVPSILTEKIFWGLYTFAIKTPR